jgi:molecular chaperone IbpA
MTKTLTLRSLDIPSIHKFGIGFDNMFDELMRLNNQQSLNYPPYNVIRNTEDSFDIEIAVSGFSEGEVIVNLVNQVLSITGQKNENPVADYLHKGISTRNFVREFTLAEHVEVLNASQKDGILTIKLERIVPEDKKPKAIAINYVK